MNRKILILGIDGADFYLVNDKLTRLWNYLSKFKRSLLRTTLPPKTPNAWISSVTGVNPGKHGVFDFFLDIDIKKQELKYASIHDSRSKFLWEFLIENDVRVAIVNFPFMYPAPRLKGGVFIGGLTVPKGAKDYTYPNSLYKELSELGYIIDVGDVMPQMIASVKSNKLCYLKLLQNMIISRIKAIEYILKSFDIDMLFVVEVALDRILHWFIEDVQSALSNGSAGLSEFEVELLRTIKLIDSAARYIYELFKRERGERVPVVVYSDHGFRAVKKAIFINTILKRMGFIKVSNNTKTIISQDILMNILERSKITASLLKMVPSNIIRSVGWKITPSKYFTEIFSLDCSSKLFYFSNYLWYNKHSKLCRKEIERIFISMKKLSDILEKFGVLVIPSRYIYKGPMTHRIPPFVVITQSYSDLMPSSLIPRHTDIITLDLDSLNEQLGYAIPSLSWRGDHNINAVFMTNTCSIQGNDLRIYDIAPSILSYYGIDIPKYMDGRVVFKC